MHLIGSLMQKVFSSETGVFFLPTVDIDINIEIRDWIRSCDVKWSRKYNNVTTSSAIELEAFSHSHTHPLTFSILHLATSQPSPAKFEVLPVTVVDIGYLFQSRGRERTKNTTVHVKLPPPRPIFLLLWIQEEGRLWFVVLSWTQRISQNVRITSSLLA